MQKCEEDERNTGKCSSDLWKIFRRRGGGDDLLVKNEKEDLFGTRRGGNELLVNPKVKWKQRSEENQTIPVLSKGSEVCQSHEGDSLEDNSEGKLVLR